MSASILSQCNQCFDVSHIHKHRSQCYWWLFGFVHLKALVAKTASLQKIPFGWNIMSSEDYVKQVKTKGEMKKFDFIHMIQVLGVFLLQIHGKRIAGAHCWILEFALSLYGVLSSRLRWDCGELKSTANYKV